MATYNSYMNSYQNGLNRYMNKFNNPYSYSMGSPNQDVVDTMTRNMMPPPPKHEGERSNFDRVIDGLSVFNYASAGFMDGLVDGSGEGTRSPWQGAWEGIKAGNPFGEGFKQGETTYSDVLGTMGWQPEGLAGRIAKGATGFVGDVLLDPSTYLTGGVSAIVKGTGKTGKGAQALSKLGDDVARASADNFVADLSEKGINPDLAKRLGDKKLADGAFKLDNVEFMTEDMASEIIKSQTRKRGVAKSTEELANSSRKLADKYNEVVGLRNAKGVGDVTWGVGNLPFAPKSWEKFNVRLGNQAPLQKIADTIGTAKAYQGLRSAVYGSQIGRMFSTKSPLWKLAQDEPAKLWEAIEYLEHTRGLKMDKLAEEKTIKDYFKSLNLTPAENDEILKLLQDKTIWSKVKAKVNVSDLSKFKEVKNTLTVSARETKEQLDKLKETRQTAQEWKDLLDDDIIRETGVHDALQEEMRLELFNLDVNKNMDLSSKKDVVKILQDEVSRLDKEINASELRVAELDQSIGGRKLPKEQREFNESIEEINELHKLSKGELDTKDTHMTERAELSGQKVEGSADSIAEQVGAERKRRVFHDSSLNKELQKEYKRQETKIRRAEKAGRDTSELKDELKDIQRRIDENTKSGGSKSRKVETSVSYDKLAKGVNNTINEEVFERGITSPTLENTYKLKNELSHLIYDREGHFMTTHPNAMDELVKMLNDGHTVKEVQDFIDANPNVYNPHWQEVNKFVAQTLGYRNWNEDGMKFPLAKVAGVSEEQAKKMSIGELNKIVTEKRSKGELTTEQEDEFMSLLHLEYQRKLMRQHFLDMSPEELQKFRTEKANERLMNDFFDKEDAHLTNARREFLDDQSAGANRKGNATGESPHKAQRYMTDEEKVIVTPHLVKHGVFRKEAIENATPTFQRTLRAIADNVDNVSIGKFGKSYMELTSKQQKWVLGLTKDSVAKGKFNVVDDKLGKKVFEEAQRRAEKEVEDLRKYTKDPTEMLAKEKLHYSQIAQTSLAERKLMQEQLSKSSKEYNDTLNQYNNKRKSLEEFYVKQVKSADGRILELETEYANYKQIIDEIDNTGQIETLTKKLSELEESLANDDAIETWMRMHNQSDLELLKDPERYSRIPREKMNEGTLGLAGERGVRLSETLDKRVFFDALKKRAEKLHGDNWTYDQLKKLVNTPEKMKRFIAEHEFSHQRNKDWTKNDRVKGDLDDPKTADIERRADEDAIDMLENFDVDVMLREANPPNAGRLVLEEVASSEKVIKVVRELRSEFDRIGAEEVGIGKLDQEAFEALIGQYVPHITTPYGEAHFAKLKELTEHGSKVSHDLGYGVKYNPYAKGRTIQGKSVEEINDYFRETLKGKNLFSENVADVYLARAMQHVDLMYDDKYMRTMMNVFGKDIPADGIIEKGYKAVMNHGMMRKTTENIASMNLSMTISNSVSTMVRNSMEDFRMMAETTGRKLDNIIEENIEKYLKENWTDETVNNTFKELHDEALKGTKMPRELLDKESVPMVEMNTDQIQAMRQSFEETQYRFKEHNETRLLSTLQRNPSANEEVRKAVDEVGELKGRLEEGKINGEHYWNRREELINTIRESISKTGGEGKRIEDIMKNFEKMELHVPPQIKQVNDAIVQKANQSRQLQMAKDQSRFLQLYDKFLHFMKLQQTTILPAFHMRNAMSNTYLNWLAVGREAVDPNLQLASKRLAMIKGDKERIKQIAEGSKFWNERFRPLNIPNPHPSLVDATELNSGQLHWDTLYDLAVKYDVIDEGFFAQDIGAGAMSKGLFKGLKKQREDGSVLNLDPTDTANFVGYKKGAEIGSTVENSDRLLQFASLLRQGKSIDEAVDSTKKFLFDYSDLTAFEMSAMKRIMPYYTWLRKNARLQVSQLIEQPEKIRMVAKVMNGIEHTTPGEERINNAYVGRWAEGWVQLPWDVQTGVDKFDRVEREPLLFNPAMPFMDLNRIPDPTQPVNSLKELFTQTSPQIKVPVEQALNANVFLDSDIVGEGENQVTPRLGHLANQFGAYNYGKGFFTKDNPADFGLHTLATLTGLKANSVDYERSRHMFRDKLEEEGTGDPLINAIRRALNKE